MGLNLDADYIADFVNLRASNPSPSTFSFASDESGTVAITFTNETTSPNFDTGGNYTGGVYTVPINALYELIAELNVNLTASIGDPETFAELILFFDVNGDNVSTYDLTNETSLNDSIALEFLGDLVAGDLVTLKLRHENVTFSLTIDGSLSVVAQKEGLEQGETVNLEYIIPNSWYVKDIIADLTTIFNLAWETDVFK